MSESFEGQDPHADIEHVHRIEELESLIAENTGERRKRAVERLKKILQTNLKTMESTIRYTTDEKWGAQTAKEKEELEARLRSLEEEG